MLDNFATPRKALSLRGRLQPVPDSANRPLRISSVRSDILAGDAGDELPVAVLLAVQDQGSLVALVLRPESLAAEERPSSNGILKRGSPVTVSSATVERSFMP